jgi:FkbM family methyltransferase
MLPDLGTALGDRLGRGGSVVGAVRPAYARLLQAVYGSRGLPWRINGEPIRIDPSVRHLAPRENERVLFDYLRANIAPGDVVFDIGSFLGTYAILEARWAGERGRVFAFEPSPSSFAVLERHVRMNGLDRSRLEARCAAVGARAERRRFTTFEAEPYRNMMASGGPSAHGTTVDVLTLDDVCGGLERPPTWIRMDVQGLEFEVLAGAAGLLRAERSRLRIVAEMHPQHWPDYGIQPSQAADRLAAFGLRATNIVPGADPFAFDAHSILEPL